MNLICLQIDLARQKENLKYVKSYIDFAAANGYNSVLLYLENAVRTEDTHFFNPEDTYSTEEVKEIVAHADSKGIDIIPAFENLGHMEKFLAYKELSHLSELADCNTKSRFGRSAPGNTVCPSNPEVYAFTEKYIRDVCALFKSPYVHMGLDEVFDFAICPRCQEQLANGKTKTDMFLEHILKTHALVTSMGKTMMMWDDFFEYIDVIDELPRDIIFCNWNYVHIGDEPGGHWTNRIKRDWFHYYDKLGFRYIFCPGLKTSSALMNIESITEYAEKYHPFGALMTAWERSDGFYLGGYPSIAYAGRKWSGSDATPLEVYTEILQDQDAAELILSNDMPHTYSARSGNIAETCENDYLCKRMARSKLDYVVSKLKTYITRTPEGLPKDILTDIYDFLKLNYLSLLLDRIGTDIFNNYETRKKPNAFFIDLLLDLLKEYDEPEINEKKLWEKYRDGILSANNSMELKYQNARKKILNTVEKLKNTENPGVFYAELMLNNGYSTVKGELKLTFTDGEEQILNPGNGVSGTYTSLDIGGNYVLRFAMKDKPVEKLTFSVFGEGAIYPCHFRYMQNGIKYVASRIRVLGGNVEHADNLLYNDTRFALMGYDDGIAHFFDLSLAKQKHVIEVDFQPL